MQRQLSVDFGNLVLSLSEAMDLASAALAQHQQRTAFVVLELGRTANLSIDRLENLFVAALLHDIGALSLEDKVSLHDREFEEVEDHCLRGEMLLAGISYLEQSARTIRFHHKTWQTWGESIETPVVFDSQLLFLADHLERAIDRKRYILHQHEDITAQIKSLSGSSLHPEIVDLLLTSSEREEFWLDLVSPRLYSLLLQTGPFANVQIDLSEITALAGLFRNIIDFRSRFTATHSAGVAAAASLLSQMFGLTPIETSLMEVAGDLHDVGKLAIPNAILEKPGHLTRTETAVMKSHTYYTYSIINTIGGLKQIAEWAAYHHEKLDGSGYPFRCRHEDLSTGSRIMAVADIFTALNEDRPYRPGMNREGVTRILQQFSDNGLLDKNIVKLLLENYGAISEFVSEKQQSARDFYERQSSLA